MIVQLHPQSYEPTYFTWDPPTLFNFKRARTKAISVSLTISGLRLENRLSILSFEPQRVAELKALIFNIFWEAEINA